MKQRRLLALLLAAHSLPWRSRNRQADRRRRPRKTLSTELTGAAEVPGPGDPDGSGTATITVNPGREEVCWEINAAGIGLPAAAAHIHVGATGVAGPVVVTLSAPDAAGPPAVAQPWAWTATWLRPSSRTPRTTTSTSLRANFGRSDRGGSSSLTAYQYTVGRGMTLRPS